VEPTDNPTPDDWLGQGANIHRAAIHIQGLSIYIEVKTLRQ